MDPPEQSRRYMAKRVELKDARTGRKFVFSIDLTDGEMRIDGVLVERKQKMEKSRGVLVFGAPHSGPDEVYRIEREPLNRVRKIWGLPEL